MPAGLFGLLFGDIVFGQALIQVDVQGYLLLRGVPAVLIDGGVALAALAVGAVALGLIAVRVLIGGNLAAVRGALTVAGKVPAVLRFLDGQVNQLAGRSITRCMSALWMPWFISTSVPQAVRLTSISRDSSSPDVRRFITNHSCFIRLKSR